MDIIDGYIFPTAELALLMPEIVVMTMACLILIIDAYLPAHLKDLTYQLGQATLLSVALLMFMTYPDYAVLAMNGMYISDPMGSLLKIFVLLVVAVCFVYSRAYLRDRQLLKGEFFVLGLFAALGMMVLISAQSLLTIYLGLELLSLSLYAMVAMHRDSVRASEAAMKYFVLGALASGMLLYGMSMLYGFAGTLELTAIAEAIRQPQEDTTILVFALVFVVAGLAFKLGAVPFHMWIPDVYEGAPTAMTLFISTAPKLAAFAMMMRLLVDGMEGMSSDWQGMLIILSVLSMAIGNIVAIAQTNIKRMLAYSTISHIGFLMLGILTATSAGYAASLFYTIVYTLMSMGGFGMILLMSRSGFEADSLDDLKGLNERSPWYAMLMMILMLSMAGIPPLLGFWAKWSVLSQIIQADMIWLASVAVLFSVIGAFYYLRIVKLIYFDKPQDRTPIQADMDMQIALSLNGLLILGLGILPHSLMTVCLNALSVT